MKLSDWLAREGKDLNTLAAELGAPYYTARRVLRHERMPDKGLMKKIVELTGGEVTANDFYELATPATKPASKTAKRKTSRRPK